VRATTNNAADASVYAAIAGADDATLHIIILNKNFDNPADFSVNLAGGRAYTSGEVWAFDAGSAAITQRTAIDAIGGNAFVYTLPARTAAHIVLHAATGPTATPTATVTPGGPTLTPTSTRTATPTPTPTNTPVPVSDLIVYGDALQSGWDNWSWNATINFANASPVQSGVESLALTYTAGWAGLSFRAPAPVNTASYTGVSFWVYGVSGSGAVNFNIQQTDTGGGSPGVTFTPAAGQWTPVTVTWAQLGKPSQVARLNWQEYTGSARPTFYIDTVRLVARCVAAAAPSGLSIARSGNDAILTWPAAPAATGYQVWRDTVPYFVPGSGVTPVATATAPTFTAPNCIGNPAAACYLAVGSVDNCGQGSAISASSPRVGELSFEVVPGQ